MVYNLYTVITRIMMYLVPGINLILFGRALAVLLQLQFVDKHISLLSCAFASVPDLHISISKVKKIEKFVD